MGEPEEIVEDNSLPRPPLSKPAPPPPPSTEPEIVEDNSLPRPPLEKRPDANPIPAQPVPVPGEEPVDPAEPATRSTKKRT
jgi:hypothetical protein